MVFVPSAAAAVVGGGVVFFPDTRGRLGGGGPAVAGDWRLGITYDDLPRQSDVACCGGEPTKEETCPHGSRQSQAKKETGPPPH